jgi:hypothetical protein
MKQAWYLASLLCGSAAILWVMLAGAASSLSHPALAAFVAIGTIFVMHCGVYYSARLLRMKNPDAISRTHVWTSPAGCAGAATEKDVYESQHGRGRWNPARDALLLNFCGPLGANFTGFAVLFVWSVIWPIPLLRIGAVTILPAQVAKNSTNVSAEQIRKFDANLADRIRTTTGLRVLDGPDLSKTNSGSIAWQAYREEGVDAVLAIELTLGSAQTLTGHVYLIGVDTGQPLWSRRFPLNDQGIHRNGPSDVVGQLDELANQVAQGLRSRLVRE